MSAISSMSSVPPCASSSAPMRAALDDVASTPNNSSSMRSGAIAAAPRITKARSARPDALCKDRAVNSLPDPIGPVIITRLLLGAIFFRLWRKIRMAELLPSKSASSPERPFRSSFSRFSLVVSSARLTTRIRRSELNGFSIYSYAPRLMAATAVSILP